MGNKKEFNNFINKANLRLKDIFSSAYSEAHEQSINGILKTLEGIFSDDWELYLENQKYLPRYKEIKASILKKLEKENLSYSILPETNSLYVKNSNQEIIAQGSLNNIDLILEKQIFLKKEETYFFLVKAYFLNYSRLEALALNEILN